jgi:hypothetical protein
VISIKAQEKLTLLLSGNFSIAGLMKNSFSVSHDASAPFPAARASSRASILIVPAYPLHREFEAVLIAALQE